MGSMAGNSAAKQPCLPMFLRGCSGNCWPRNAFRKSSSAPEMKINRSGHRRPLHSLEPFRGRNWVVGKCDLQPLGRLEDCRFQKLGPTQNPIPDSHLCHRQICPPRILSILLPNQSLCRRPKHNLKMAKRLLRNLKLLSDCLLYTSPSPRDRG